MANALQKRLNELDKDKTTLSNKYKEKIELYDTEINRLKNELLNIKNSIEEKYESEIVNQKTFYDTLIKEYNEKFLHLIPDGALPGHCLRPGRALCGLHGHSGAAPSSADPAAGRAGYERI